MKADKYVLGKCFKRHVEQQACGASLYGCYWTKRDSSFPRPVDKHTSVHSLASSSVCTARGERLDAVIRPG